MGQQNLRTNLGQPSALPGGFAAGTLVHTKEGLVPIEKIKVGDWVLSKHEGGQGERAYKRVTQTFVHDEQEVMVVTYGNQLEDGSWWGDILIATLNHPFWAESKGWIEARSFLEQKSHCSRLEVLDHAVTKTYAGGRTYVTDDPNHIWFPSGYGGATALRHSGDLVDIRTAGYVLVENPKDALDRVSKSWSYFHSASKEGTYVPTRKYLYRCTVYNLEVEDYHTYYVGQHGVWVHNTDCNRFEEDLLAYAGAQEQQNGIGLV